MSDDTAQRFAFELPSPGEVEVAVTPAGMMPNDQLERALRFAREVAYHWDIKSDAITWSANLPEVLGVAPETIATGRQFASLMDSENFFSRYDTVLRSTQSDSGDGVGYEIGYRLKSRDDSAGNGAWIEDTGRWFADPQGSPAQALGVMRIADERHKRDQQLSYLSNCDPLTGMMNRARLTEALGEAIEVATADKMPCAFAILAVNNLAVMNEAYGYEVADEVIVALGLRLRQVMRMGDGIARYSGSKFAIILNSCKPDELNAALERFMRAVRDSVIETRLGPVWALLSIGAVSLPAVGDNASTAIAHAEEALSEAFRLPSDGYVVFTSSEERQSRRMLNARCATEIVNCLRDGLFKLAFQPVFDAKSGDVLFHEALLRMEDTTGALITAGHLVPIAERLGLIRLIDRAVLQLALKTLRSFPSARLSVNISATTVTDLRWNQQLLDMIEALPEEATRLIIEITETAALDNIETSRSFSNELRNLGCGVALDDFGADYTSYRNLKELALTYIKLDGSFCCNLSEGGENSTFVKSMVNLAHAFGLKVIAEWVDSPQDAEILVGMGVDCLQGNLLGEASITPPWIDEATAAFSMNPPSLDPVASGHFTHEVPAIEEPKMVTLETISAPEKETCTPEPEVTFGSVEDLDDDVLEAQIAALESGEQTAVMISPKPMAEPQYVTAMALPNFEPVAPSFSIPDSPAVEKETTAATENAGPEENLTIDVEESLSQLRAAIAELSAAFGRPQKNGEEERLAS